ncbi:putative IQ motif, EF-hand binding, P-loop containing nucleoside triphosphate hydrolase [Medicago truncatula]|uniref:IQ calmodulin-binding motif protein n=1 Tax=Medicago truncatula TaxID=3880 RepID=G7KB25_MEDTR|nr:protein IQ-DOMAIN 31 [Medicago truncatula]XP_024639875.1 protein IQ-DOMAIN 31 [Medicago truncatula]AES96566.1 IQ calmodulin-binding motif protein [Medicago truncatula]RHN55297.1 putative IQ motif, EF-hand binding, P-loop containing nucleoside triphosphate hydrolase [Medicago truncatula]
MGKGRSPGKWIRSLLSGGKKSSSKSSSSKKNDIFKSSSNKDALGSSELTVSNPISTVDSLQISAPISGANVAKAVISEKEVVNKSSHERGILSNGDEKAQAPAFANVASQDDLETLRLTEAAIKLQSACRGYQARREFQTLKAITQLQAFIRGHLVRRQAVSALYCVKGIVTVQALARGYNVRRSDIGLEVLKIRKDTQCSKSIGVVTSTPADKLSENAFVCQLLASSTHAFPLSLNSDLGEPYLASKWLDRWTTSSFWAPLPKLKKKLDSVSAEKVQVKRTTRKSPAVKADEGSSSGSNKQKQRPKKDSNHSLVSAQAQEHPKKEIEKSSLKKTRVQNVSDRSEIVNEKRKHSSRATSDQTVTDVSEQGSGSSSEKIKETTVPKSEKVLEENNDQPKKNSNGGAKEEKVLGKKTLEEKNDKPKKSLNGSAKDEKSLEQKTLEENNDKPKKSLNGSAKEEKSLGQKTPEENNDKPKKSLNGGVKEEKDLGQKTQEENNDKPKKSLNGGVKEEKDLGQKTQENNDKPKKSLSGGAKEEKGLGQKAQEENNGKPKKSLNGSAKEEKGLRQKALEQEGHNDPNAVLQTSMKKVGDEEIGVSEDLNGGDKIISNNYQRRASLPANFNDQENEIHNTPSPRVPSYMAPTESAKARLRGQGSPRFATDIIDKNSFTRRHSLSSSLNSKSGSFSPRVEKLITLSGRGVARTDKSLSSSRDGTDKMTQPQWRR